MEIENLRDAFFTGGDSSEEQSSAMQLYAFLLHDLRQKYGTPQAKPGSV
jgi:hypothetical protein